VLQEQKEQQVLQLEQPEEQQVQQVEQLQPHRVLLVPQQEQAQPAVQLPQVDHRVQPLVQQEP
jgi:hypothetical protein